MEPLPPKLIDRVVESLPWQVRELLVRAAGKIVVAGGMIRDVAAGEKWKDVDLFGSEEPPAEWKEFATRSSEVVTDYLIGDQVVQYIHTDCPPDEHILERFDFICVAGMVWWKDKWCGWAPNGFLRDIKLRRLRLNTKGVHPKVMNRVLKLAERGYRPDTSTLALLLAGLVSYTDEAMVHGVEQSKLRENLVTVMTEGSSRMPRIVGLRGYDDRGADPEPDPQAIAHVERAIAGAPPRMGRFRFELPGRFRA